MFTREFALNVCTRFAKGEDIDQIAEDSGNLPDEIEALLKAYHREMQEAVDRMEGKPIEAAATIGNSRDMSESYLKRIADALEKMVGIFEKREC